MVKQRRLRKRAPVGAPPGTLVADPGFQPTNISYISYDAGELSEQENVTMSGLSDERRAGVVVWVNVNGLADIETIKEIGRRFGLHSLALEDVVNLHQRPKVEEYGDHLFVATRMPVNAGNSNTEQVTLFLGPDFVLTFQEHPGDVFDPVRARLRRDGSRLRESTADYLAYSLLDAIVDAYFPVLESTGEDLELLEDTVVERPTQDLVGAILNMRRRLLELRRSVWPQRELFNALLRHESDLINEKTKIYLRDCYDHTIQLIEMIETYREVSSGLLEIYLSSLSNRMNDIMKVLTIMATVFIPLSFIASVYGMNFDPKVSRWNMPELGWTLGYPFALGLMLIVAIGLLLFFYRRGWIGRAPK